MSIEACRELVERDMRRVDELIHRRLSSDVALINQMSGYIVLSGGKRLRPQLVLLAAKACDYQGDKHIEIAAIIEFIHTATLLHDDVVDASDLRRGQQTANNLWGNEAAVLVGDFLYSRSFEMMVGVGRMRVMEILAATTNRIAEGEVLQLLNVHQPDIDQQAYLEVIRAKTAQLFEAATQLGAVIAGQPESVETALIRYGRHLGTAFQIADDVLDYTSSSDDLGKRVGDDLAEGKPTLPLIFAMRDGNPAQRETVAAAIREGGREAIDEIMAIIESSGALASSMAVASQEAILAKAALADVPDSAYRQAMYTLADYSLQRKA